jgi:formyltetrahydrofolate deformylase
MGLSWGVPMKIFATVTVIGLDKTGVVARVTGYLFEQKGNIEALEEQVTRGQFSMTLQVSWREKDLDRVVVERGLRRLGEALGMEVRLRFSELRRKQRVALMVTREPGCAETLLEAIWSGRLRVEARVILSNRRDLVGMGKRYELPFEYVPWEDRVEGERRALEVMEEHQVDFVVLARFMKILSPNFVWRYKNKIINVHPSLLPSFPGPQAYRQAYEHGVKIVGVTAHFVSMHLDEGPIIAQESFKVRPGASLKEIVEAGRRREAEVLLRAVRLYLGKRLDVYWGTVKQV